jgi:modulator of FtsH protease HflK
MFDRLIDLLVGWFDTLNPFIIIKQFQNGVHLRNGKFKRVLLPGLHFKLPLFDEIIEQHVVTTTMSLPAQSLYTKDKQNIVVKTMVKYKIKDVQIFILEIFDATDAISDITQSIVKKLVVARTLDECISHDLDSDLTTKVRNKVKSMGVEIEQITLTDIAPIRSIRLINDNFLNQFG